MKLLVDTTYRSQQKEIMDDLTLEGSLLRDTLDKIAVINKFLGGNQVTLAGVKRLIISNNVSKNKIITIIDLGCGEGSILRDLAKWGANNGYRLKLIGIDANLDTINYAKQLSVDYPEIEYAQIDIFSEAFDKLEYDIALATLFFHHFEAKALADFLSKLVTKATIGVVVNDLHRHKLAYYLYQLIMIPVRNTMVKIDGSISILRGFKKKDLLEMSQQVHAKVSISWKWAFRYLWILEPSVTSSNRK